MRVAIQGQAGSFHDAAAKQWYGSEATIVPCASFADAFEAYETGEADAIVTAVENSIYGSINDVYQLVEASSAPIIGEVLLEIDQMLIGFGTTPLEELTKIYSHPVALAQCRNVLRILAPNAELIEFFDTAGAVEYIKQESLQSAAAVAGKAAARLYDMPVLKESVQDNRHNFTRFLVLQSQESSPNANRASLVITTNHKPGALVEVLQAFANVGVNLAKLQSQPIVGEPWKYKFFIVVDCAGKKLREVVNSIEQTDHQITLLGEYEAAV